MRMRRKTRRKKRRHESSKPVTTRQDKSTPASSGKSRTLVHAHLPHFLRLAAPALSPPHVSVSSAKQKSGNGHL